MQTPRAPQHHIDAGEQLHRFKGLDHIILSAQAQAVDTVGHPLARREEDHRYFPPADALHDIKTMHARQHHIQQDEVETLVLQQVEHRVAALAPRRSRGDATTPPLYARGRYGGFPSAAARLRA